MKNKRLIPSVYKILLLYEDMQEGTLEENNYQQYLEKISIFWLGMKQVPIYGMLQGLKSLGRKAEKAVVKTIVFDIISQIESGEEFGT